MTIEKLQAHHGFTRIFFLNGHGGNVASIEAAFSELYAQDSYAGRRTGFACKLKPTRRKPRLRLPRASRSLNC